MRLAHARPATITLMAGSVLLAGASGVSLTVAASTAAASTATASTAASGQSCEPLQPLTTPSSPPTTPPPATAATSTAPTTAPATTTAATTTAAIPATTPATPAAKTGTATPTPKTPTATPTATPATTDPSPTSTPSATRTRAIVKSTAKATATPAHTHTSTPTATPTPTGSGTATATPARNGARAVAPAAPVSLCVSVARAQASSERGHPAQWTVGVWTTGGNVPDASLQLQATPASGGAPGFSFGCAHGNGTSACDLGAVDANSAPRQLRAQLTVPVTASSVTSVRLVVIGIAAHMTTAPEATATVTITAPPAAPARAPATRAPATQAPAAQAPPPQAPSAQGAGTQNLTAQNLANVPAPPAVVASPLPVGSLPGIPAVSPTLTPGAGGNAASLFPSLDPAPGTGTPSAKKPRTRPLADTSALPEGGSAVDAQLAGLAALGLAFVLALTQVSIRRRSRTAKTEPRKENPQNPPAPGVAKPDA